MKTKIEYQEGAWFAVTLNRGGYAIGVVARAKKRCPIILCYFFVPKYRNIPKLDEVCHFHPSQAIAAYIIGDLYLKNGKWPIIGVDPNWQKEEWPMPSFIRRDPLTRQAYRTIYSENDLSKWSKEELINYDDFTLSPNTLHGAGGVEVGLTLLLDPEPNAEKAFNQKMQEEKEKCDIFLNHLDAFIDQNPDKIKHISIWNKVRIAVKGIKNALSLLSPLSFCPEPFLRMISHDDKEEYKLMLEFNRIESRFDFFQQRYSEIAKVKQLLKQ